MTKESCIVGYEGAEFLIVGDWNEGCPDTLYEPGERAGFEHYDILFGTDTEGNDYDLWEILSEKARGDILDLAEEEIMGRD